jgi:hypothetical protein
MWGISRDILGDDRCMMEGECIPVDNTGAPTIFAFLAKFSQCF